MAFGPGKASVFKLDDGGGSLTDISAYLTSVSIKRNGKTIDVTTFGKNSEVFIAALKGATIDFSGKLDSTAANIQTILVATLGASASKTFAYGPFGSTSGYIKVTGECFGTGYNQDTTVAGDLVFSGSLQITDDITDTTW